MFEPFSPFLKKYFLFVNIILSRLQFIPFRKKTHEEDEFAMSACLKSLIEGSSLS
jgi:hypothetical protein